MLVAPAAYSIHPVEYFIWHHVVWFCGDRDIVSLHPFGFSHLHIFYFKKSLLAHTCGSAGISAQ